MTDNDPGGNRARALVEDHVAGLTDDEFAALQARTRLPQDPKERAATALADLNRRLRVNVDDGLAGHVDQQRAPGNPLDGLNAGAGTGLGTPIAATTTRREAAMQRAADAFRDNIRPGQTRD